MSTYSQNPTADAHVWSAHSSTNYGETEYLSIGEGSDGTISEIFLKFDLSSIPSCSTINSAQLRIYQFDSDVDWLSVTIQIAAELCDEAWSEDTITWSNRPGSISPPQALVSFANNTASYVAMDVKEHVQAIKNGTYPDYGFRIRYTGTSSSTRKSFRSREYATSGVWPVLIADYTAPIKIAATQGNINKPIIGMKIAPTQGPINKTVVGMKIMPTQGGAFKTVF